MAQLPLILAGPILRHCTEQQFTLWLMSSSAVDIRLQLFENQAPEAFAEFDFSNVAGHNCVRVGESAYVHLISVSAPIPSDQLVSYDLILSNQAGSEQLSKILPQLAMHGERPGFVLAGKMRQLLHGSCRKPHYPGADALPCAEKVLASTPPTESDRPNLLLMSGDQIYCDDVAGPMLDAIIQTVKLLGLYGEKLQGAIVGDSEALYEHPFCFYQREQLLPLCGEAPSALIPLFKGAKKPIFTTIAAHNHVITLAEVIAMYALVWSPALWPLIQLDQSKVDATFRERYEKERLIIEEFVDTLPKTARALANIPVYMIFDDHDVTDDWNLTRGWEETAYQNPFSRQILGNALVAYWLFQGWGNAPEKFPDDWQEALKTDANNQWQEQAQDAFIDRVLDFGEWHYSIPTSPPIHVLDTRTHRWRSESNANKPSGLMDWENLSELQQKIIADDSVILVSAAPIFGVKLIEVIQRIFTFFGKPLVVDAENWMAHTGAANVLLNMFVHHKAPDNLIILSGDVHYSFVYDVRVKRKKVLPHLRKRNNDAADRKIWQITASGIKNCFPDGLIKFFDRFDRFLYSSRSPLNWFTKRRKLAVKSRKPRGMAPYRLVNHSGLGLLCLGEDGSPTDIRLLHPDRADTEFPPRKP